MNSPLFNGFEENKGQFKDYYGKPVPEVLFKTSVNGMNVFITTKGITYGLKKALKTSNDADHFSDKPSEAREEESGFEWCRFEMSLEGLQNAIIN